MFWDCWPTMEKRVLDKRKIKVLWPIYNGYRQLDIPVPCAVTLKHKIKGTTEIVTITIGNKNITYSVNCRQILCSSCSLVNSCVAKLPLY